MFTSFHSSFNSSFCLSFHSSYQSSFQFHTFFERCERFEILVYTYNFLASHAGCEFGDKDPAYCSTSIRSWDCYDNATRSTCCATCARLRISTPASNCNYGDRADWCKTLQPASCFTSAQSCCQTCYSLATGPPGWFEDYIFGVYKSQRDSNFRVFVRIRNFYLSFYFLLFFIFISKFLSQLESKTFEKNCDSHKSAVIPRPIFYFARVKFLFYVIQPHTRTSRCGGDE